MADFIALPVGALVVAGSSFLQTSKVVIPMNGTLLNGDILRFESFPSTIETGLVSVIKRRLPILLETLAIHGLQSYML